MPAPTAVPPEVQVEGAVVWAKTLNEMEPPAFEPDPEAIVAVMDAVGMAVPTCPAEGPATVRVGAALLIVKELLADVADNPPPDPVTV